MCFFAELAMFTSMSTSFDYKNSWVTHSSYFCNRPVKSERGQDRFHLTYASARRRLLVEPAEPGEPWTWSSSSAIVTWIDPRKSSDAGTYLGLRRNRNHVRCVGEAWPGYWSWDAWWRPKRRDGGPIQGSTAVRRRQCIHGSEVKYRRESVWVLVWPMYQTEDDRDNLSQQSLQIKAQ